MQGRFRFSKSDILHIPDEISCYNRTLASGTEAFCILLRRFSYPNRYSDMISRFGRFPPECSVIISELVDFIYNVHSFRLSTFQKDWLPVVNLERYARAALDNCWAFVDGTVRPVCRPCEMQRALYNGHKRVHSIKFQSVVAPNGLIAHLYGLVEGRRHDSGMLADSNLLHNLQQHCNSPNGQPLCVNGDMAYPLRPHLQTPYIGLHLNPAQAAYNKSMSTVRTAVEWVFGDIINFLNFLDFKKNLRVCLSAVGKAYIVYTLF